MRSALIDPIAEVQGGATVADWVGAIGTVVVGVMAAAIAFMQYRHGKFRPRSEAFRDKDWRVKVQITNDGAGAGWVVDVHLTRPTYHTTGDVEFYVWEIDGRISTERPIPFPLAGNAQAVLFLIPASTGNMESSSPARNTSDPTSSAVSVCSWSTARAVGVWTGRAIGSAPSIIACSAAP